MSGGGHEQVSLLREIISFFRRLLVLILPGPDFPKISDRIVFSLLVSLKITPRQLRGVYKTFQKLRSFDSVVANTTIEECSTDSVLRIVRKRRQWVEKLMRNLLELGGYQGLVTWQGFLYVMMTFCSLSKMELAQVMFFIVAKEMKSWTVDYVTTMQLQEFYEDYNGCPIKSFDTKDVGFHCLSKAKYRMIDFIELTQRFSQLVNPIIYLQRSVQQMLPNLRFWKDVDNVRIRNRQIKLDHFRYMKSLSMADLAVGGMTAHDAPTHVPTQEEMLMLDIEGDSWDPRSQIRRRPKLDVDLPLPLPGPGPPGWIPPRVSKRERTKKMPEWLETTIAKNEDPKNGRALGTAAMPQPLPAWAAPLEKSLTVADAKDVIVGTHRVLRIGEKKMLNIPPPKKNLEFQKLAEKSQSIEFVRKSRERPIFHKPLLSMANQAAQGALVRRPQEEVMTLNKRHANLSNAPGAPGAPVGAPPGAGPPGAPPAPTGALGRPPTR